MLFLSSSSSSRCRCKLNCYSTTLSKIQNDLTRQSIQFIDSMVGVRFYGQTFRFTHQVVGVIYHYLCLSLLFIFIVTSYIVFLLKIRTTTNRVFGSILTNLLFYFGT